MEHELWHVQVTGVRLQGMNWLSFSHRRCLYPFNQTGKHRGKTLMKRLLLLVLIALLLLPAGFGLSRIGVDRAITELARRLETKGGFTLAVEDAGVRFLPTPAVHTGKLLMTKGSHVLLESERARLDIDLMALLFGQVSYGTLRLDNARLALPARFGDSEENSSEMLFSALSALAALELHGSTLVTPDLSFSLATGRVVVNSDNRLNFETTGRIRNLEVRASGTLSPIRGKTGAEEPAEGPLNTGKSWQVQADIDSPLFQLRLDGTSGLGLETYEGRLSLVTPSLRSFLAFIGYPLPDGPGFEVAQIDTVATYISGLTLNLRDLRLKLDGNQASGALQMRLNEMPSSLQATLAFDNFDTAAYTATTDDDTFKSFIEELNRWRRAWKADVRLSTQNARFADRSGSFAGSLVVNDKTAELAIASTTLGAERLSGRLAVISPPDETPVYNITLNAEGMHTETLTRFLPQPLRLEGQMNMNLLAQAHGTTLKSARESLKGELRLAATQLSLAGISASMAIENVMAGKGFIGWPLSGDSATTLQNTETSLNFAGGKLELVAARGLVDGWQMQVQGGADLAEQEIDLELSLSAPGTGKETLAAIRGRLGYPVWQPLAVDRPLEETGAEPGN